MRIWLAVHYGCTDKDRTAREVIIWMSVEKDWLEEEILQGRILSIAERYVASCAPSPEAGAGKKGACTGRFPNVAGFCRYVGIGQGRFEELSAAYPDQMDKLAAVLEDEALNSSVSAALLGTYLKRRLGYDGERESRTGVQSGQLRVVFDHDIMEDGQ